MSLRIPGSTGLAKSFVSRHAMEWLQEIAAVKNLVSEDV